jgi:predicted  nucleic acid-binding Zn-ribbon protein
VRKELLQLDQRVFKEYILRLSHAQDYHLRVTRRSALREATAYMKDQYSKVQDGLRKELVNLFRQNKEMQETLRQKDNEIRLLNEKVRNRECTISELTVYTRHIKRHVLDTDFRIQKQNLTSLIAASFEKQLLSPPPEVRSPKKPQQVVIEETGDEGRESPAPKHMLNLQQEYEKLNFYGSYISVGMQDKVKASQNNLVRALEKKIHILEHKREHTLNDFRQISSQLHELRTQFQDQEAELKETKEKLRSSTESYEARIKQLIADYEAQLVFEREQAAKTLDNYKRISMLEIKVQSEVIKMQQRDVN